jgi:phage regulator Rha-like protein
MASSSAAALSPEHIGSRILLVRGEKVLLDTDLAILYGVSTGRLNEQVKRNLVRFPPDFLFRLTNQEVANLKSQFAISSLAPGVWGGRRSSPFAFTEHGCLMAANVLNSRRAVQVSIYVVRAFVRLRQTLAMNKDLAKKLEELEHKVERLALKHDTLASETRAQFRQVVETLRQLMTGPEPARRPIGFVAQAKT